MGFVNPYFLWRCKKNKAARFPEAASGAVTLPEPPREFYSYSFLDPRFREEYKRGGHETGDTRADGGEYLVELPSHEKEGDEAKGAHDAHQSDKRDDELNIRDIE